MPKRNKDIDADVIYLDSADSSGVETEYEHKTYEVDGFLFLKRRRLYKVRYKRNLPQWLIEEKELEKQKLKELVKNVVKDRDSKSDGEVEGSSKKLKEYLKDSKK